MKRKLMYLIVILVIGFIGASAYYFYQNSETGVLMIEDSSVLQLNAGEDIVLPFFREKPKSSTIVTVTSENENVVSFDEEKNQLITNDTVGGSSLITISTSNKHILEFSFTIVVGDGSDAYPFFISSVADFEKIGKDEKFSLDKSFLQTVALDLESKEREPIGTTQNPFSGTFDGGLNSISNIKISTESENAGLFGCVTGEVSYCVLKNVSVSGTFETAGGIVGSLVSGTIKNCSIESGNVDAGILGDAGGIVGKAFNADSSVVKPTISACSATNVSVAGNVAGGIAGNARGAVFINSFSADCTVEGETIVGGIVGKTNKFKVASSLSSSISYARESVVKNCYSTSKTSGEKGVFGGIIGTDNADTFVVGSFFQEEKGFLVAVSNKTLSNEEAKKVTVIELGNQSTFVSFEGNELTATNETEWDFVSTWKMDESRPLLTYEGVVEKNKITEISDTITSASMLIKVLNDFPQGSFELGANIDFEGSDWNMIPFFEGSLNGSGFTISNFNVVGNKYYCAMFANLGDEAVLHNFKIEKMTLEIAESTSVLSVINNGSIESVEIKNFAGTFENCENFGTLSVENYGVIDGCAVSNETSEEDIFVRIGGEEQTQNIVFGGVVANGNGRVSNSSVSSLLVEINTKGTVCAGGVVGNIANNQSSSNNNEKQIVNACVFEFGSLSVNSAKSAIVGGVVGKSSNAIVQNSVCSSQISAVIDASTFVGGITAVMSGGTISQCFMRGPLSGGIAGGLVSNASNGASITESYFNNTIKAVEMGGVAHTVKGSETRVWNCYAVGSLKTLSSTELISSFAPYIEEKSTVENCFTGLVFEGSHGEQWKETKSKVGLGSIPIIFNNNAGYLVNCAYDETLIKNAKDQSNGYGNLVLKRAPTNFVGLSTDAVFNGEQTFVVDLKFNSSVWLFSDGAYPILAACESEDYPQLDVVDETVS